MLRKALAYLILLLGTPAAAAQTEAVAGAPALTYVFSVRAEVAAPVEQGEIDGGRRRFIAITGGAVYGPRLTGDVLPGGGDWQTIRPGGLTEVLARYFLKTSDGAVIEVTNPGVRVADPAIIERLSRGEDVDPSLYYFRTTPSFKVSDPRLSWMTRAVFVARGIRKPDHVIIDYFIVE